MKGRSASVSIRFSQRDFPLAINHAIGTPAARSIRETIVATAKESPMAFKASDSNCGSLTTLRNRFNLRPIPKIGGNKIIRKKNRTATP